MSSAEGSLGSGKPGDAEGQQGEAGKKLADARAALERERQKVLQELEGQVRRVVIENLQEMLDRQSAIRKANQALAPKLAKERQAVIQLQQLAPAEQRVAAICQQTLDLVNETEFSVALPPALETLQRNMLLVSGDLTGGRGDEHVINTEIAIEADLKDLLDTFKETPTGTGQSGECNGCKGNLNKLLAELKVVRMMQLRVNKGTVDADGEAKRNAAAAAELPAELREKIGKLRDGQQSTRDAMDRLNERFGSKAGAQ